MGWGGSKIKLSVKMNVRLVKSLRLYAQTLVPCNLRASWVLSAESVQQGKELGGYREGWKGKEKHLEGVYIGKRENWLFLAYPG